MDENGIKVYNAGGIKYGTKLNINGMLIIAPPKNSYITVFDRKLAKKITELYSEFQVKEG